MSKSIHIAEVIANDGESQPDDSQLLEANAYERLKWALEIPTSSSPTVPVANAQKAEEFSQEAPEPDGTQIPIVFNFGDESQALETPFIYGPEEHEQEAPDQISQDPIRQSILQNNKLPPGWKVGIDKNKKHALFDANGKVVHDAPKKMMSSHVHSSGSTTQENPQSWTDQALNQSFGVPAGEQASQASLQPDVEPSTFATVPAHSYREDDTGHIDLMKGFEQGDDTQEFSQDRSHAADEADVAETQIALPETPATNPFERSIHHRNIEQVLPPSELFATTQISPLIQVPTSAASHRPSPDVYSADNIASPEKKAPNSSPSTRNSFNSRANLSHRRERAINHVSRKKREKRRNAIEYPNGSQSSSDGFESESRELHRRTQLARPNAEENLALFTAPARPDSGYKRNSDIVPDKKPTPKQPIVADDDETEDDEEEIPAASADIDVPGSTEVPAAATDHLGRRRSDAEEYIAQTNGSNVRDTQEYDMVVDSQVLPRHNTLSAIQDDLPELDNESETEDAPSHRSISPAQAMSTHNPDLLCETTANSLKTPKSKGSSLAHQDDVVLETSPYRIRPLRDFAEDSSPIDDDQLPLSGIGFTQDEDFQNLMSQQSPPPSRSQHKHAARTPKTHVETSSAEADESRSIPQSLPTSSLHRPAGSLPPVFEVGGTPKSAPPVHVPVVSTGPTVLDTPQALNNAKGKEISNPVATTVEQSATTDSAIESVLESRDIDPVTPSNEESSRLTRKRKNDEPEARPSKKSKHSTSATANLRVASSPADFVQPDLRVGLVAEENNNVQLALTVAEMGQRFSTAPEAQASSTANFYSVQSSALSELSPSADVTTPEAFKSIGQEASIASAESVTETNVVGPKGRVGLLKRKRATETPPSSLTPTAPKSKAPTRVMKRVGRPSKVSQGAKATPKAVKALRGLPPSSGTRSSTRQAAASNTTPSNSLSRDSVSRARSESRLSTAPSIVSSNGNMPSTPVHTKAMAKKSGENAAHRGLFHNMAFAVSYVSHPKLKEDVLSKIYEEDGLILETGFDELFAVDDLPVTPSRRRAANASSDDSKDLENIKPHDDAKRITFACVIADNHSRKVKYMQALSLDLPCLHGNWILKCVAQQRIIDWAPYLLCSGEPDEFDGAARSRGLAPYSALSANFSEHFDSDDRPKMLEGKRVLVVVGTTKAMVEKRKAYVFIIHALGAEKVGTVPTAAAAKAILETATGQEKWDWVYVNGNEMLGLHALDTPQPKKKKNKKQRGQDDADSEDEDVAAGLDKLKVKVIGDHFIVQSLILGRILDDGCARAYNDPVEEDEDGVAADVEENGEAEEMAEGDEDDEDELS